MKEAKEEYERCINYIIGVGEISVGSEIFCNLICCPAEAAGRPAAHLFCVSVCYPVCKEKNYGKSD